METSCTDLEFIDLSNATEDEIKEIHDILNDKDSNTCIELLWEVPLTCSSENSLPKPDKSVNEGCEAILTSVTADNELGTVVGQALLYAPPPAQATQLPMQAVDMLPSMETFVQPMQPSISAASPMGAHYSSPYLVPRTLPYLRAYPHIGVPLFSCTLPSAGELTHVQSPYAPFLPLAAPVTAVSQSSMEKTEEMHGDNDIRPKVKGSDHHFTRRSKRKHLSDSCYYGSSEFVQGQDTFNNAEDMSLGNNRLATVPCVPVPVPPTSFPVTSGALPMPSYPPGLYPLTYSQISGPQASAAPVYYVPVFNHSPYNRYIASAATAPMLLPVSMPSASVRPTSESECSTTNEGADDVKSSESLAASTESIAKTSESSVPIESDSESASGKPNGTSEAGKSEEEEGRDESLQKVVNEEAVDNCSLESSETLTESTCIHKNSKPGLTEKKPYKSCNDSSRCWADLFKKQCSEMNGVDYRLVNTQSDEEPNLDKDLTNGKLYNVPNSDKMM